MKFFSDVAQCFTNEKYFSALLEGLRLTLLISVGAAIIGLFLGTLVALVKLSNQKSGWMKLPRAICNLYVIVIRGTPMAVQLFIMAFVIFAIRGFPQWDYGDSLPSASIPALMWRKISAPGILSVDIGQTEAGRALGLTQGITMRKVIIPQAIKNVIPAIGNELIALIKETSIVSMIGMFDLTAAARISARPQSRELYAPMIVAALFYLVIVYALTFVVKKIERRLRSGDKR